MMAAAIIKQAEVVNLLKVPAIFRHKSLIVVLSIILQNNPFLNLTIFSEPSNSKITHPALKQLIKENYPTAKVIMYDELPIAGPYPATPVRFAQFV